MIPSALLKAICTPAFFLGTSKPSDGDAVSGDLEGVVAGRAGEAEGVGAGVVAGRAGEADEGVRGGAPTAIGISYEHLCGLRTERYARPTGARGEGEEKEGGGKSGGGGGGGCVAGGCLAPR